MNIGIFLLGLGLLLVLIHDLVTTALSSNGAGWLTGRLSVGIWNGLLWIRRTTGWRGILSYGGTFIALSILSLWLLGIWGSCTIMILSEKGSVINVETNTPGSILSKTYYTGYTLSTLGMGDMEPGDEFWEIFTTLFSFTGLIFITVSITYLIPVLSAQIEKQRLSAYISTLGCSVDEIVQQAWNGQDLQSLSSHFVPLSQMILQHAQNHHAYPIIHYFHTEEKKEAFVLNLANLDEVLTFLLVLPEKVRPSIQDIQPLRNAISLYLSTVQDTYIQAADQKPPFPDIKKLTSVVGNLSEKEVEKHYQQWDDRRKMLLKLVENDGWHWEDLKAGAYQDFNGKAPE